MSNEIINKHDGYTRFIVYAYKTDWDRHKDDPIVIGIRTMEPCDPFGMPDELGNISLYITSDEARRIVSKLNELLTQN